MRHLTCMVVVLSIAVSAQAEEMPTRDPGIVRLLVTRQDYDVFMPWQKNRPARHESYGILVDERSVLAPESLIRNHTLIELQKPRSGEKIAASVVMADPQVDLVLLRVDRPAALASLAPLPPTGSLGVGQDMQILQFDKTEEVQRLSATVKSVAMEVLPAAPFRSIAFTLHSESNVDAPGNAVVHDGQLAGMVIGYDENERTATVIPASDLARFLEDANERPYRGVATAGFFRQALVDPAKRAYLGVKHDGVGVLVLSCIPNSPADRSLKPNDVIIEWDGHAVDSLGFYEDMNHGRLDFSHLIRGRRSPGDKVPVRIVRDGKEATIEMQLERRSEEWSLIPENFTGQREEYLIEGGLVIRELSGRYLRSYGGEWLRNVDPRLAHMYLTRQHGPTKPGERVVILSGVLADPINIGYQHLRNQVITAVNGEPIDCMSDVFRIARRDGYLERISLQSVGVDLVLDRKQIPEANARLAESYGVPETMYRRSDAAPQAED